MTCLEANQPPKPYQEYRYLGGRLDEEFFYQAQEFLGNGQNLSLREARIYCRSSRNYAQGARLRLEPEQERLYAYLRAMMPSAQVAGKKAGCPWQFADQPLLAEVFLLTQDTKGYQQFITSFPEVFKEENQ